MSAPQIEKELRPFCYEHLVEMMPYGDNPPGAETDAVETVAYVCSELNCPVHYNTSRGYFIAAKDGERIEQSTAPSIRCPNDGTPMYLAETHPEHRSYRLWRCPQCAKSLTNLDSSEAL